MTLAGRTAFITGTNRGLGRAFAETFAASGANVIAHARRDTRSWSSLLIPFCCFSFSIITS